MSEYESDMGHTPINQGAHDLTQNILRLLDDDEYEDMNPLYKYSAIQMALFTAFTGLLGFYTEEGEFEKYKTILLDLHEKLTISMMSIEQDFLMMARASLHGDAPGGVVH